tara:strand:- start:15 stop:1292 length:1278 start_codon:yes stop_codon:yes gene_type:complete
MKHFLLSFLLAVALMLGGMTSSSGQSTKTTYDFSTAALLTNTGTWYTQADITIDGTAYRLTCGGNGSFSNVSTGGAANSACLQKDGAGGDSFTLQRADGQPFQFYGIWVKHKSMNSYSTLPGVTLPPWYTLTASTFSYQDNTPMTSGTNWDNYTGSEIAISAGTDGVTTTSVAINFPAILNFWIDDIIVGPIPPSLSTITTQAVSGISTTTATGNGNITDLGSPNPTQHGVVWSTSSNPTVALTTKTEEGAANATGAFSTSITGLTANTTYYVRAYATNTQGTSYGNEVSFITTLVPLETEFFEDEIAGTTAFTNNGFTFDITGGKLEIANTPGWGWSGNSPDNFYVDNNNNLLSGPGVVGSFKIQAATFVAKDLYVFPSNDGFDVSNAGDVIMRGKLGGSTQFTQTLARSLSDFPFSNLGQFLF